MIISFTSIFILVCLLTSHEFSCFIFKWIFLFTAIHPDLNFTVGSGNDANDFSGLWIKPISALELWFPWLLHMKSKAGPGLSICLRSTEVILKENTIKFASTSASLSRGREVAAHFSTSAIEGNITSYMLQFISSMLYVQQTLENWYFLLPTFCTTEQVAEFVWYSTDKVTQMLLKHSTGPWTVLGVCRSTGVFQGLWSLALGLSQKCTKTQWYCWRF